MPQRKITAAPLPPPNRTSADYATSEKVPDIFQQTKQVPTLLSSSYQLQQLAPPNAGPLLGAYSTRQKFISLLSGSAPRGDVAMHETGHSVWYNDLTQAQRDAWTAHHTQTLAARKLNSKAPVPTSMLVYDNDPSHSFAESYGKFASDPLNLKRESPATYDLIRNISGFEYRRGEHWQERDQLQNRLKVIQDRLMEIKYSGPEAAKLVNESNALRSKVKVLIDKDDPALGRK